MAAPKPELVLLPEVAQFLADIVRQWADHADQDAPIKPSPTTRFARSTATRLDDYAKTGAA
jgi:hypothetical protein